MRWITGLSYREREIMSIRKKNAWHRWFAWHPVKIDNQTVWLEMVERSSRVSGMYESGCVYFTHEYRNLDTITKDLV